MIAFLLGVPGKLTSILNAVNTRAPLSTALSTASWDSTLLAKLNNTIETSILSGAIQTGYTSAALSAGSGEDAKYIDVTISAVADTSKCQVIVQGYAVGGAIPELTARLTSTTNLRIACAGSGATSFVARWYVTPFK